MRLKLKILIKAVFLVLICLIVISCLTQKKATTYNLTINVEGQGTTDPSPGPFTYYNYNAGTKVDIEAIPAYGWRLNYWEVHSTVPNFSGRLTIYYGFSEILNITMDSDKTVTAYLEEFSVKKRPYWEPNEIEVFEEEIDDEEKEDTE